jgi:hypothetical protein
VKDGYVETVQPGPVSHKDLCFGRLSAAAAPAIKKRAFTEDEDRYASPTQSFNRQYLTANKTVIAERGLESTNTPNCCRYSIISRHIML